MFHGSYKKEDVQFLLKQISLESTSIVDKEKSIQKNLSHYSEMITHEKAPTAKYMRIFYDNLALNEQKFALHLMALAYKLTQNYPQGTITLVSLARAGTPIGVLLKNILDNLFNREAIHYTISIIRDKGVDFNALKHITKKYPDTSIAFIDGWTGKGIIGQQLKVSVDEFNISHQKNISSNLYVVADISGTAYWSSTNEDYLIPSAILNSTISGLVSRTILNKEHIGIDDFHGCIYYEELKEHDISQWFVKHIMNKVKAIDMSIVEAISSRPIHTKQLQRDSNKTLQYFLNKYQLNNKNYVKPGIGESTRVLLRRMPKEIIIKNNDDQNIEHILHLAKEKNIPVILDKELCYNCVAIIETID